jgi:hypothetical protein
MGKHIQKTEAKGSQGDLQLLVAENPGLLNSRISTTFGLPDGFGIEWISPIPPDYAEYSDDDFLQAVELDPDEIGLSTFWPRGGPHWDGLGIGDDKSIFLVEAKAHIAEMVSPPSGASPAPLSQIRAELEKTKAFLHAKPDVDWTIHFFQYANRLAHIRFLRFERKKPTFLVFVYFLGDQYVHGPTTKEEWLGAINLLHSFMGVGRTKLTPFVGDVFIHVDEIASNQKLERIGGPLHQPG